MNQVLFADLHIFILIYEVPICVSDELCLSLYENNLWISSQTVASQLHLYYLGKN